MRLRIISVAEANESIVKCDSQNLTSSCRLSAKNGLTISLNRDLIDELGVEVDLFDLTISLNQIQQI